MSTQRRTQHICDCCGERSIYGSEHTPPAKWTTANVRDFDGGGLHLCPTCSRLAADEYLEKHASWNWKEVDE